MKKIFSVLLVVAIIVSSFTMVAFADYLGVATDKTLSFGGYSSITVPSTEVDSQFTVSVKISNVPYEVYYDEMSFTVKATGVEVIDASFTTPASIGFTSGLVSDNKLTVDFSAGSEEGMTQEKLASVDNILATYTLKRIGSATTGTLEFDTATYVRDSIGKVSIAKSDMQALTINFESAPEPTSYPNLAEETFDTESTVDGIAVNSDSKVWTVFQKNATGATLGANTYGIQVVTGGKTYKFAGIVDVPAEDASAGNTGIWAIKLVAPEQKFAGGEAFAPTSIKAYWGESGLSGELID